VTDTGAGREPKFSDDREWWWDGTHWLPANQAPVPPPPPTQAPVESPGPGSPVLGPPMPPSAKASGGFPRWLVIVAAILFLPITVVILIVRTKWSGRTKAILSGAWIVVLIAAGVSGQAPSGLHPVASASPSPAASAPAVRAASPSPVTKPSPVATPVTNFAGGSYGLGDTSVNPSTPKGDHPDTQPACAWEGYPFTSLWMIQTEASATNASEAASVCAHTTPDSAHWRAITNLDSIGAPVCHLTTADGKVTLRLYTYPGGGNDSNTLQFCQGLSGS
jgi:hypothetical protein